LIHRDLLLALPNEFVNGNVLVAEFGKRQVV